jgi:MFS family permease
MLEAVDSNPIRPVEAPYPTARVGWYAAIVLAVLYWVSILDRFIIALLVDPIKRDLALTDLQFSVLQGIAITGTQLLFGLLFGALADRYSRRRLIFAGAAIWALATAACGLAHSFWHLLLARLGVGGGEASLVPCGSSMLADLHPRERQTRAMAVFSIGSTVGTGTAFLIGGLLIECQNRSVWPRYDQRIDCRTKTPAGCRRLGHRDRADRAHLHHAGHGCECRDL